MPRCYMVKKGIQRHEDPAPCSPTEATVAPPCYSPQEHHAVIEPQPPEYAELGASTFMGRSAADTEAAHDLLSLAQSLPPLTPTVVTVLHAPDPTPMLPVYTYTIQPTNLYILAEETHNPTYQTVHTITPLPSEYIQPQQVNYVAYPEFNANQTVIRGPEITAQYAEPNYNTNTNQEQVEVAPKPETEVMQVTEPSPVVGKKSAKYVCNECGKTYATSSNLSRHKQTHRSLDSGAAKRCSECGKVYVSMPALAMHVLTHRMNHVCGTCGKQFSRPWLLIGHLRSHTGEKPYLCVNCGKTFADRSNLRAHLQTHSLDKKYECSRCGKTFALRSYLNKHQEAACVRMDVDE